MQRLANGTVSDFGGKSEAIDHDLRDTAQREYAEELSVARTDPMLNLNFRDVVFIPDSRYILFIADLLETDVDLTRFGTHEGLIEREIILIPRRELALLKMHPRLHGVLDLILARTEEKPPSPDIDEVTEPTQ